MNATRHNSYPNPLAARETVSPWQEYSPFSTPLRRSSWSGVQLNSAPREELTTNFLRTCRRWDVLVPRSIHGWLCFVLLIQLDLVRHVVIFSI